MTYHQTLNLFFLIRQVGSFLYMKKENSFPFKYQQYILTNINYHMHYFHIYDININVLQRFIN
jgi:hypothetical protein